MKKFLKTLITLIITFLVIWIGTLLKCEHLTQKYYEDFKYAYTANSMLGDMEYFKVLSCDGKYAKVYYVSENMSCADILSFTRVKNKWIYDSWIDTV